MVRSAVERKRANDKYRVKNRDKIRNQVHQRYRYPAPTRPRPELCECCGRPPAKKALALDHEHLTNTFRGWLCNRCNAGIGLLGDSLDGILRAAAYLQRSVWSG